MERLEEAERRYDELMKQREEELVNETNKQQTDISNRESELSRHTDTICILEQQLDVMVRQNKECQQEIAALKAANAGQ